MSDNKAGRTPASTPARDSVSRRRALTALGALSAAPLLSCDSDEATGPESDATLSALAVSDAALSPVFTPATTVYTSSVGSAVASVTVTATASQSGATVAVNGIGVPSGTPSQPVALDLGANAIAVLVTAPDASSTRAYVVKLTRSGAFGAGCVLVPSETAGPYPLPAALELVGLVRSDIREDKPGVPLTLLLTLVDVNQSCDPIAGAAVYVWHCDKDGAYSGYSSAANGDHLGETFLRGTQVTDADGRVSFTTIYPGWYPGRITHMHFQVYLENNRAVPASATSQIAFPQAMTTAVYNSALYAERGQNTTVPGFAADTVFGDGTEFQLATMTGDVAAGFTATLTVGVAA
jgi:protocatechuate 3,4-dioxygenase beta subunit